MKEEDMTPKNEVKKLLASATKLTKNQIAAALETPPDPQLGDLAFPCFLLSKKLKKAPKAIAAQLAKKLKSPSLKVQATGPYLNFFFNKGKFVKQVISKISKEKSSYGDAKKHSKEQVIFDMIGTNPNKAGHVGHIRNGCTSDTIVRCMQKVGYKTVKQSFMNDMGVPTSMVFWGYKNLKKLPKKTGLLKKEDQWQGAIYEKMQKLYENNPKIKAQVDELHSVLEHNKNMKLVKEQRAFTDKCINAQSKTWERLRCSLDLGIHESDIVRSGMVELAIRKLQEANALYEENGAVYFELKHYPYFAGMQNPDKLLIRPDGRITYTGKDIAMQFWKHQIIPDKFKYSIANKIGKHREYTTNNLSGKAMHLGFNKNTKSIYVIGAEQQYVIAVDIYSLKAVGADKYFKEGYHLPNGLVGFGGKAKIASRKGTGGLSADEILDKAASLALKKVKKSNKKMPASKQKSLAEAIGSSAVRYYLIKTDPIKFIQFDFDEALSLEGNTGPYLQYALVRAKKILKKARKTASAPSDLCSSPQEFELAKKLAKFPDVVLDAAEQYAPHKLANYAFKICKHFSTFYEACPVLQAESPKLKAARLALVKAFAQTLKNSLELLGIEEVEMM